MNSIPRQLRIIITCVIVFLLLGAIVNVALAWGCALGIRVGSAGQGTKGISVLGEDEWLWFVRFGEQPGDATVESYCIPKNETVSAWLSITTTRAESAMPRWTSIPHPNPRDTSSFLILTDRGGRMTAAVEMERAFGLPWLTMTYRAVQTQVWNEPGDIEMRIMDGIPLTVPFRYEPRKLRALPLRIIWTGFVANSIVLGAGIWIGLWLVTLGPLRLRRHLRIKRGLCPKCAYPAGKSPICTECGKPLPSRLVIAASNTAGLSPYD